MNTNSEIRVTVIDMQPITPAVGGGRLRLLGLYHNLAPHIICNYLGTYDWPGNDDRDEFPTEHLREILVPLDDRQFQLSGMFGEASGSQSLIDTLFSIFGRLSENYLAKGRGLIASSQVIVFSHPWAYPLFADCLDGKTVIYDSHNVESLLKAQGLEGDFLGREIVKTVLAVEMALINRSDHMFACSVDDKNAFALIYGAELARISVVPNGAFTDTMVIDGSDRHANRSVAFIGSQYGPNVEAALFIARDLAPSFRDVTFHIIGKVGEAPELIKEAQRQPNVVLSGAVGEQEKTRLLGSVSIAINPMNGGSGTNIKMFDFMAAGLPILTTGMGARGVTRTDRAGIFVADRSDFAVSLGRLLQLEADQMTKLGDANRSWVKKEFAWEKLSRVAGDIITRTFHAASNRSDIQERIRGPSATSVAAEVRAPDSIAVLSTYGIKCGIAGYTEQFVDALTELGHEVLVLAADTPAARPITSTGGKEDIKIAWYYDNVDYATSTLNVDDIIGLIKGELRSNSVLHIQYHHAFFSPDKLMELIEKAGRANLRVATTFHNSRHLSSDDIQKLMATRSLAFVHTAEEAADLRSKGVNARFVPLAIPSPYRSERISEIIPTDEIGTFGFIRPHKGIANLIAAMPYVLEVFPKIHLNAYCALYPSEDSERESERCLQKIGLLGLEQNITLDTSYYNASAVQVKLSNNYFNVLPYEQSSEGASAAAGFCLGARVPLITSRSTIFDGVKSVTYQVESTSPKTLALSIMSFLSNRDLYNHYHILANQVADEYSQSNIAKNYISDYTSYE